MRKCVIWLVLTALPALAGNLCKSNAAGNWSSAGTWVSASCGGGIPGNGDVASITHSVTVNVDTTVGASVAASPQTAPTLANTGGSGGTWSGASGSYRAGYSWVTANGETAMSPETGNITLTQSSSAVRVTIPALPTGVTSANIYLTGAGTGSQTETLYATGVTTTTHDPASASWNNGTQTQAAAPSMPLGYQTTATATTFGGAAIRVSSTGSLTVGSGVKLTVRGDIILGGTTLTVKDDSTLEFDPSASASPTTFSYALIQGTTNSQGNSVQSGSTTAAHPASIQTIAGSYKSARIMPGVGVSGGTFSDSSSANLAYVNISRMGDSTNSLFNFSPGGTTTPTFDHVIFDTCGTLKWAAGATVNSGWSITNNTFRNTNGTANVSTTRVNPLLTASTVAPGAGVTRVVSGNVFDLTPSLSITGGSVTGNFFAAAYDPTGLTTATVDGNLIVMTFGDPAVGASVSNNYAIFDAFRAVVSDGGGGSVASAGTNALSVAGTPWTAHYYQSCIGGTGNSCAYMVLITSGKGMNQVRAIADNTSNGLITINDWTVTPDSTSHYEIWRGQGNPHGLGFTPAGSTVAITGNVYESQVSDNNGDAFKNFGTSNPVTMTGNLELPSIIEDNSGTLATSGGETSASASRTYLRNTYFTGAQTLAFSEPPASASGYVLQFRNNIAWAVPGVTYRQLANAPGLPAVKNFGPYKLTDSQTVPPVGQADMVKVVGGVSQSDHNTGWGLRAGWADTNFPGGGIGYNTVSTVTMGLSDVDVNPMFVDTTRRFWTWARRNGSTGSVFQIIADGYAQLAKMNDRTGYNSAYNIPALIAWVKQGYEVQNPAIWHGASDGGVIGSQPARAPMHGFFTPVVY